MKRNDIKALYDKTPAELNKQLLELQQQLAKTSLELAAGKLEDIKLPSKLKDDLARVKTILRRKALA